MQGKGSERNLKGYIIRGYGPISLYACTKF